MAANSVNAQQLPDYLTQKVSRWKQEVDNGEQQIEYWQSRRLLNKQDVSMPVSTTLKDVSVHETSRGIDSSSLSFEPFSVVLDALEVMQSHFFEIWQGTWPTCSDWTAAVMSTQVSATLNVLSSALDKLSVEPASSNTLSEQVARENLINRYFTHTTSFYFGENAFALRGQAYDDMLWLVLEWLESITFIRLHSKLHYQPSLDGVFNNTAWYGLQFIPSFAHRARLFYDLASRGWDTSLCGGGMVWSPYLAPYKNAITNQLYITASVSMYLYFPGDKNPSPFQESMKDHEGDQPPARAHDPKYLEAAVEAYNWLMSSNMTNQKGLFVDGFHIRGWRGGGPNGSIGSGKCDIRDEMVYTYNQGVLLSGMRGLWESTGSIQYIGDGHQMIRNVISATGWHIEDVAERRKWAGIGRNGILEEACDASGACSQDAQTFKGIFFHHLTLFCAPLPVGQKEGVRWKADAVLASLHRQSCREYGSWIKHNAEAAYRTRNSEGEFGMWWGIGLQSDQDSGDGVGDGAVDYRNKGVPRDEVWRLQDDTGLPDGWKERSEQRVESDDWDSQKDLNDRGRGRTVETQAGGLALLRALWNLVHVYNR